MTEKATATTSCTVLVALRCVFCLLLSRCSRPDTQAADTCDQADTRLESDPDISELNGSPWQSVTLQELEATCKMQLEDVDAVDVGHYAESALWSATGTDVAIQPKLIEWLAKFEARNLKVFKDIRFDDQATTETTYQVTRLAAWLAEFEANHHQKLLPASSTDIS
ncbi:hypothetical protein GN244_ATG18754 [Phytophthora infestans]|uniref:Secreted RxLR effector peptide protein n=1 Tax=Phytophthora infestans TaxID=4787 RepID=A0A833WDF6_PHYIN|nr:hypothetical protein GN244_ATG18754 [Phytophthora infestans]